MLSDRQILARGRPAWVNSTGRKILKLRRKRSSRRTRASSSRSLRRSRASLPRHWSSKRPPRRSCASSRAHPGSWSQYSEPCWRALRMCEAKFGMLHRYRDGAFVAESMVGAPPALVDALLGKTFTPPPGVPLDRMLRTKKVVHTLDAAAEENKPLSARLAGARSHIVVPMLKEDELVGAIAIYRQEVRPFSEKQIELVKSFASKDAIAIEN